MRAEEIDRLLPHMTAEENAEMMKLLAQDKAIWRPLPGPQSDAYHSKADVLGYGGAAGGGKTDLVCGLALTAHARSLFIRREATQLQAVYDRFSELLGSRDGFNGQDKIWRIPKRQVEFGSTPNLGDEEKYQGRPHDLKVFDEATAQLEAQVRYIMGWNRTSNPNQRCRSVITFNPPTTSDGQWVLSYFAPWLDDKHHNPAFPGELRWFATIAGRDIEVPDGREFVLQGEEIETDFDRAEYKPEQIIQPKSRTFIPSRVTDNPYYMKTGYISTLQALPEPLRSQMLSGDFKAGIQDDQWQVIPTAWVEASMARWQAREIDKKRMDSMGVDVARGGKDQTIISRRHGTWFDKLLCFPGKETPDGDEVVARVLSSRRDKAPVHIDVVGVGSSPYDTLKRNAIQAIAISGAESSLGQTREHTMDFANKRAEVWWRMREALDPANDNPVLLPNDAALKADLCAPRWKLTTQGILVEPKENRDGSKTWGVKNRLGRSPDRGDAVCLALIATKPIETSSKKAPPRHGNGFA